MNRLLDVIHLAHASVLGWSPVLRALMGAKRKSVHDLDRTEDGDIKGVANEGAVNPFINVLPPIDTEIRKIAIKKLTDEALEKGITMYGDAYVFEHDLVPYEQLLKAGDVKQHASIHILFIHS